MIYRGFSNCFGTAPAQTIFELNRPDGTASWLYLKAWRW